MDSGKKASGEGLTRSQIVSASAADIARRFKLGDADREWLEAQLRLVAVNEAGACKRIALKHRPTQEAFWQARGEERVSVGAQESTALTIADEIETRGSY